ncbi:MAG: ATP-dependent helicase [Saccharospirillaceae bacterium]|nr:ATP-dependent helicase [Saccharospirillaceae bacterium]
MDELQPLAKETLDTLEEIANTAQTKLQSGSDRSTDSFASSNSFTGAVAHQNLANIQKSEQEGFRSLTREPAIMRMVLEDDEGNLGVVYISRTTSIVLGSGNKVASYHSDIGKLAETPLGEIAVVKLDGKPTRYYVIEKLSIKPQHQAKEWDSKLSVLLHIDADTMTISSLRSLLASVDDEFERMLAGVKPADVIKVGIEHQVRTAMGLRDQPILDQFQGTIFRLPLDEQLIILGPPGTGKTTTLIKRLGQKLDVFSLNEDERHIALRNDHIRPHQQSWLMFTPSELLKHYLKEAFSLENISASDEHVKTWTSFRNSFARNTLGVLKTANGGRFLLNANSEIVHQEVIKDPRDWFEAFAQFHKDGLKQQVKTGLTQIEAASSDMPDDLLERLQGVVSRLDTDSLISIYQSLRLLDAILEANRTKSKDKASKLIKDEQVKLYRQEKTIFASLNTYLESIATLSDDAEDDEEEDLADDAGLSPPSMAGDAKGAHAYATAIRALARSYYLKKSPPKSGRNAAVLAFLNERIPSADILNEVGRSVSLQAGLGQFIKAHTKYVSAVSSNYARFRGSKDAKERFYSAASKSNAISPIELDLVILTILKNVRELLEQTFVTRNLEESEFDYLKTIVGHFRNQIMVDEATDFSLLELACMESLTSLNTRSFFACGDFNQRITSTGLRQFEQLEWVSKRIKAHSIRVVYRQSQLLNRFANDLLVLQQGDLSAAGQLPDDSIHEGVSPVLGENIEGEATVKWLADRINEVERSVGAGLFPTIAVLVNSEGTVQPMAEQLTPYLTNLKAVACSEGRSLGEGTDVRVFDIRHIKGLEFEAVFFVGIDQLAVEQPELFDRYLYVGTTRAATYLGITCNGGLPASLEPLRHHFVGDWK